jgi:hypothetical protein
MTREEIEQLDDTEPYSFETDREEWWYKIGLKEGLETADQYPRKELWDSKEVCEWILNNYPTYEQIYTDNSGSHCYSDFQIGEFIRNLRKAMKENNDCN